MGSHYKIAIYFIFFILLSTQSVSALSLTGFTDKFSYKINETINYTVVSDQNLTSNISIYLINSSESRFNFTSIIPNSTNFTVSFGATVPRSGEYFVKANFTFNNTYYESSSIVKISKAHSIVIATNKPAYSPGETINFTVRATDVNSIGISNESVTIRLMYTNNDTVISSKSSTTNSGGEYISTFTAPTTTGSYRLTVNDWVATKIVDISSFDLVSFIGDSNGNIKTKFYTGDTVYVYMDLFDSNQTRYTGTETLSFQLTYPNGTQNNTLSYPFSGSRLNTSFTVRDNGVHNAKITAVSTSKSITLPLDVGKYEIVGWLERNATQTNTFFPNETANILVKVFNVSTGEIIKTALDDPFELTLLDSSFANSSTISNSSTVNSATGIRAFTLSSTPNSTGLYYVRIALNQSKVELDMKVINTITSTTPADQSYNFKNMFVGNKQTIRILTVLSNATNQINATSISVVSLKTSAGADITSTTTFNTSIVDYKNGKAGLVEFSSPSAAGLYFIKTLVNGNFAGDTQFLMKLYTACAQLDGYRWFISSTDDANLTVRVTEAKDISLVDSLAGNSSDSTNTETGNFSSVYGMHDCYAEYKTTASGSSSGGNNTANIAVTVKKIINTLSGEDITTKVSNLPNNNTDDNGRVTLRLQKPSGGWDGGTYVVELELRDKNNNTDKGFGAFQVKSMWINVWPAQVSGRWRWYFAPTENMSFNVNAYNSTSTWYYYGDNQGTGDNCTVTGVFYQGNGAEWFWPPKTVPTSKYTASCTNSSAPAKGRFNLTITPSSAFDTGYYLVRVKVNTTAGVGDVGEGWFSVKAYNVYVKTASSNYYDSWYRGVTENVSLSVDVTYANSTRYECYWQSCPANERVNETLNVSMKLIKYDAWNPADYATSKYNSMFTNSTQTNVSTRYINTTNGTVNMTLIPRGGTGNSWETGYYSAAITVDGPQGKETGAYWFEIRSFFVNLQPVKANNSRQITSSYGSGQNITINVSASNKPSWLSDSSYGVSLTNIPANITSMKLSYWNQTTYLMSEVSVVWSPNTTTTANPTINNMITVNITPLTTLVGGIWYNLEVTLKDSNGNNQTGWAGFQVKDFTFSSRTKNWQYEFNNTANISLDVAVCDGETWWCNFGSNSYSGNPVNVTVTKLYKTDSWPYTAVSGWTANSSVVNSTNNGQGIVTISPTSTLAGGHYSAELTARYTDNSGSILTSNVWFRIESFRLYVSPLKWEYSMSENMTLKITTSASSTLSDAQISCGYWPDQTSYSMSGRDLTANTTSLSTGDNLIMLRPNSTKNWVPGYCSGSVTVTSGGESQQSYFSFNMKAFSLSVSQPKYTYLKNESAIFKVGSDATQYFNITDINISIYNYENNTFTYFRMGQQLTSNATGNSFRGNSTINLNMTNGNWTPNRYYYGTVTAVDSNNSAIKSTAWIYFVAQDVFTVNSWAVINDTASYTYHNASIETVPLIVYTYKYNAGRSDWWPYDLTGGMNVTITSIERQSCTTYPCTYSNVTGWSASTATTKSGGRGQLNITRSGGWSTGWHTISFRVADSSETVLLERQGGFWVDS
ncbi:MAG: hypothetical protein HYW24_03830 [Candidatus Aenigmarchaeota archaeon]|nr:hypothetical protein [Candidatus Aenigmarchaeota archaeon]